MIAIIVAGFEESRSIPLVAEPARCVAQDIGSIFCPVDIVM